MYYREPRSPSMRDQETIEQITHLAGVAVQRKLAVERLWQSEKELRDVIETIPAMVWSTLPDGTADFFNQRWQDYTGLSLEQSLGWDWGATVHPEARSNYFVKWRECVATGQPIAEEVRLRRAADGQYRWCLDAAFHCAMGEGRIVKWYGLVVDIEDRKRAEEALRRNETYLAEAQKLSHYGKLSETYSGGRYCSEELLRIFDSIRTRCAGRRSILAARSSRRSRDSAGTDRESSAGKG